MEEFRAKFLGEAHRWNDVVIAECEKDGEEIRIKTEAEQGELWPGMWYRWYGRWHHHHRYGPQFHAETFVQTRSLDEEGVVAYLMRAPRIGKVIADKLYKMYGGEAVKQLRTDPESVVEALRGTKTRGLTPERAAAASAFLVEEEKLEEITIDLMAVLADSGLPRKTLKRAIKAWGNRASDLVRKNPYRLMQFSGCGFGLCDALYLKLKLPPAALKRQALCVWFRCASDREGDTWIAAKEVSRYLESRIAGASPRFRDAVRLGLRAGLVDLRRDSRGSAWLAEGPRSRAEAELAGHVARMRVYGGEDWPEIDGLDVSDHQGRALRVALRGRLGLFTGSPGTGKTYTAARLISRLPRQHVAVVAPTGKAAVRITEALDEYGIGIQAKTVHSFLKVEEAEQDDDRSQGGFSFVHGPHKPVAERYVVCDEASMLDTWLLSKLLGALRKDGHLLLVGDTNQLPPVGHGAPLRDLTDSGAPRGELLEIRRNSGLIVKCCAAIRDEQRVAIPNRLDLAVGRNLMIRANREPERIADDVISVLDRLRSGGKVDPVWDAQVLCAVNEKSVLGRHALNSRLQAALNPHNRPKVQSEFWVNDKVVCLRNAFLPLVPALMDDDEVSDEDLNIREGETSDDDPKVYVANGELGKVIEDHPRKVIVEFPTPRRVVLVPKGEQGSTSGRLDLGYALSCHKAQGSEWPVVLVVLDPYPGAKFVCDRSWLYTAMSRAKRACILFGEEETAHGMIRRQKIRHRKTFLAERIEEEIIAIQRRREEEEIRPPWSDEEIEERSGQAAVHHTG